MNYILKEDGFFVHTIATGRYTSREVNEALALLAEDPALKPDHVTLFDTSRAEAESLDDADFTEVFKLILRHPEKLISKKVAILIKDRRFLKNAQHYQQLAKEIGQEVEIFQSLVTATNWLMK